MLTVDSVMGLIFCGVLLSLIITGANLAILMITVKLYTEILKIRELTGKR